MLIGVLLFPSLLGGCQPMFLPNVQHGTNLVCESVRSIRYLIHRNPGYFLAVVLSPQSNFAFIDNEPVLFDYLTQTVPDLHLTEVIEGCQI